MINIDQVQTGDHVEIEWTSPQGETAKVSGKVWKWSGYQPMVGPFALTGDQFKIISHRPGEPEWAGALVVRDKDGEYWGLDGDRYVCLANDPVVGNGIDAGHLPSAMRQFGPFTVIIDADGLNVEAQYFWKQQLQARDDIADLRAKLDEAEERAEKTRQDYERLSDQYDEQVGRAERAEEKAAALNVQDCGVL